MIVTPVSQPTDTRTPPQRGVRPGSGVLMTAHSFGIALSAPDPSVDFNHPFRPYLGSKNITFNVGSIRSINGIGPIQPTILVGGKQVPMSGQNGNSPARLALKAEAANDDGLSWAVLEVSPDPATGELLKGAICQIVHESTTTSTDANLGRCPLAQIVWRNNQPVRAFPLIHFNLVYFRVIPPPGGGVPKHYFL